jgi:hypothetical protein
MSHARRALSPDKRDQVQVIDIVGFHSGKQRTIERIG